MASTPKTGGRTRSTRNKKPTTIDLDAKEVGASTAKGAADAANKSVSAAKDTATAAKSEAAKAGSSATAAAKSAVDDKTGNTADKATATDSTKTASTSASSGKKPAESASSKAETSKTMPPPAPAKSGGGGMVSALMGAAMAVVGLGAVGQVENANEIPLIGALYGGSGSSGTGAGAGVDSSEIEALKQQIAGLSQGEGASSSIDLAPLNEKIAAFEEKLNSLPQTGEAAAASPELTQRLETLEASLKEVSSRPVAVEGDGAASLAPLQSAIEDLSGKVAAIEAGSTGEDASDMTAALEPVQTAIAELTEKVTALEANVAAAAKSEELEAVSGRLPEMTASIEELGKTVTGLGEQVSGLSKKADNLQLVVDDSAEGLAALNSQSETLTETVATVKASEKVARSVAVNAIATALENDDSLTLPIASLKALVGETPETTRLSEIAQEGVPARKALVSELDSFTKQVQDPGTPGEDASLSDKFWSNAQKLVTFRSTGPRDGDDVFAILSRVRANVNDDNLQAGKAEWGKLPAEVQQQGETWFKRLELRMEAFALQAGISEKLAAEAG